jgi:hypothetical protein
MKMPIQLTYTTVVDYYRAMTDRSRGNREMKEGRCPAVADALPSPK